MHPDEDSRSKTKDKRDTQGYGHGIIKIMIHRYCIIDRTVQTRPKILTELTNFK